MPAPSTSPSASGARGDARAEIVAAAARLLREAGAHAVTTRAVAQAAGVQPPTIFRLFGDKDALLHAVAEHVLADYIADKKVRAADEDGDPVDDLRAAWHTHVDFGLRNPDVFLLLLERARLRNSPAVSAGADVLRVRIARLAAAGSLKVSEARAADMIHAAGSGAVLTLLGQPAQDRDAGLVDALLSAVLGEILTTTPTPPASDAAAVAVTLRATLPQLPALSDAERTLLAEWLGRSIGELQARATQMLG